MTFKDLIVWQKAHANAIRAIRAVDEARRSHATDIVAGQLLRAVLSVGANIAEGYGRRGGKEYIRYLEIAYGSANEVDNWLSVLHDAGILPAEISTELQKSNEEVLRILATILRKLRDKRGDAGRSLKESEETYVADLRQFEEVD